MSTFSSGTTRTAPFVPTLQLVIKIHPPKIGGAFLLENTAQRARIGFIHCQTLGTS